jgi:hypothetical protein
LLSSCRGNLIQAAPRWHRRLPTNTRAGGASGPRALAGTRKRATALCCSWSRQGSIIFLQAAPAGGLPAPSAVLGRRSHMAVNDTRAVAAAVDTGNSRCCRRTISSGGALFPELYSDRTLLSIERIPLAHSGNLHHLLLAKCFRGRL